MITKIEIQNLAEQHQCYCSDCGEPCQSVEDSFSYPGTHCNFGRGGIYYTGTYSSDCCSADLLNEKPEGV